MNKFTFYLREFIFSVLLVLLVTGCSKKEHPFIPITNNGFVDSVFQFLQNTLSPEELKQINFTHYTQLEFEGEHRFVEIKYHEANKIMLVEKTPQGLQGFTNKLNRDASMESDGTLICEDLDHYRKAIISFFNGNVKNVERSIYGKLNPYA